MKIKTSKSRSISLVKGNLTEHHFFINEEPCVPTVAEKPIKSFGHWYAASLRDKIQMYLIREDTIIGVTKTLSFMCSWGEEAILAQSKPDTEPTAGGGGGMMIRTGVGMHQGSRLGEPGPVDAVGRGGEEEAVIEGVVGNGDILNQFPYAVSLCLPMPNPSQPVVWRRSYMPTVSITSHTCCIYWLVAGKVWHKAVTPGGTTRF